VLALSDARRVPKRDTINRRSVTSWRPTISAIGGSSPALVELQHALGARCRERRRVQPARPHQPAAGGRLCRAGRDRVVPQGATPRRSGATARPSSATPSRSCARRPCCARSYPRRGTTWPSRRCSSRLRPRGDGVANALNGRHLRRGPRSRGEPRWALFQKKDMQAAVEGAARGRGARARLLRRHYRLAKVYVYSGRSTTRAADRAGRDPGGGSARSRRRSCWRAWSASEGSRRARRGSPSSAA